MWIKPIIIPVIIISIITYLIVLVCTEHHQRRRLEEMTRAFLLTISMGGACIAVLYLMHRSYQLSRLYLLIYMACEFTMLMMIRDFMRLKNKHNISAEQVLLIAQTPSKIKDAEHTLIAHKRNANIIAHVIVSDFDDFCKTAHDTELVNTAFDTAYIYMPDITYEEFLKFLHYFETMGVTCIHQLPQKIPYDYHCKTAIYGGYPVFKYMQHDYPSWMFAVKRIVDVIGAIVGLCITAILFLIFAPLIKLDSKGPVFFKQPRVGRNGRVFNIIKFRSMCDEAEAMKRQLN